MSCLRWHLQHLVLDTDTKSLKRLVSQATLDTAANRCCLEFSANYYSIHPNNMRSASDASSIVSYAGKSGRNVSKKKLLIYIARLISLLLVHRSSTGFLFCFVFFSHRRNFV